MHARAEQLSTAHVPTERRLARGLVEVVALALLAAAVVFYLQRAVSLASSAPLWMDEVLAVWTAREPSFAAVWRALKHGSEFTPPAFDALLHGLIAAGFTSHLAMRMPSIVAGLAAAGAVFTLVRRRTGTAVASLAAATILDGSLFAYAVQARPYACVAAAVAWAVVLWDGYPGRERRGDAHAAGILVLCALAVALHFYAILLVGLLGAGELLRTLTRRDVRWPVLGALALAALSDAFWWPIAQAAAAWNRQDAFATDFYARPSLGSLLHSYLTIFFPLAPLLMVAGLMALCRLGSTRSEGERGWDARLFGIALFACAVPAAVYAFAAVVTHVFTERYVVTAAFAATLLLVLLVRRLGRWADGTALVLLVIAFFLVPVGGEISRPNRLATLALARAAPRGLPLATGDGFRFFEISEDERAAGGGSLIYLQVPDPPGGGDPTNRHQVERWAAIDPALRAVDAATFLCRVPHFLLLHDAKGGHDEAPEWLRGRAELDWVGMRGAALAVVHARPCTARRAEGGR